MYNILAVVAYNEWALSLVFYAMIVGPYILVVSLFAYVACFLVLKMFNKKLTIKHLLSLLLLVLVIVTLASFPVAINMSNREKAAQLARDKVVKAESLRVDELTKANVQQAIDQQCNPKDGDTEQKRDDVRFVRWGSLGGIYVETTYNRDEGNLSSYELNLCPGAVITKNGKNIGRIDLTIGDILTLYGYKDSLFYATKAEVH